MMIDSPGLIDRLRRGLLALMANCLEEQQKHDAKSERYIILEKEIIECERLIEIFDAKLKSEAQHN
jgi:hypothetical protein